MGKTGGDSLSCSNNYEQVRAGQGRIGDDSLSCSGIQEQVRDTCIPGRITPQTNCLVIRPGIYVDRTVDNENKTENRPLSCRKPARQRTVTCLVESRQDREPSPVLLYERHGYGKDRTGSFSGFRDIEFLPAGMEDEPILIEGISE